MKRIQSYWSHAEEGILAFTLVGLAFLAFMEVVSRYLFNHSFTWFEELSRYTGVFITFLGASLGVKYGTHFSMDLFLSKAGARTALFMRIITCALSSAIFFTIGYFGFAHVLKLKSFGVHSAALQIPMYIPYLPIAFFSFTLALRYMVLGIRHVVDFKNKRSLTETRSGEKVVGEGP
ncbi:MAG: TRAP transporter small permease [Thermodesulfobacteriota bacterium]